MSIKLNTASFNKDFTKFTRRLRGALEEQFMEDLDQVLEESKQEIPVDTGAALDSAYSDIVHGTFTVGYGDSHAKTNPKTGQSTNEYLRQLHDDISVQHKNGRKAKFLEDPFRRYMARVESELPRKIRRRMR